MRITQLRRDHRMNRGGGGVKEKPWDAGELERGLCATEGGGVSSVR